MNIKGSKHEGQGKCSKFYGKHDEIVSWVDILPYWATSQVRKICQNIALLIIIPSDLDNAFTTGELALVHRFPYSFPQILSPCYPDLFAI